MAEQTTLTPLIVPYLKAEPPTPFDPARVYLCIPGARIALASAPTMKGAMHQAATLLNTLALGIACEADMVSCAPAGSSVTVG